MSETPTLHNLLLGGGKGTSALCWGAAKTDFVKKNQTFNEKIQQSTQHNKIQASKATSSFVEFIQSSGLCTNYQEADGYG